MIDVVGAALRGLSFDGVDLVPYWPDAEATRMYAGVTCAPWPNRVAGAQYAFGGDRHRLTPTPDEPGHALHGLVAATEWRIAAAAGDRIRLTSTVVDATGWPFAISLVLEYGVDQQGLTARMQATNIGTVPLPYGYCPHPYLLAPVPSPAAGGQVDGWTLTVPAASVVMTDAQLNPVRQVTVAGTDLDFRGGRRIGDTRIDHCFGDLETSATGRAQVDLRRAGAAASGTTRMSWGSWAPWVQVFSCDQPASAVNRSAVAIEPMSCPPNAYNSGIDLVTLDPQARHEADWAITLLRD